jgi:RHS repeat-associated protein
MVAGDRHGTATLTPTPDFTTPLWRQQTPYGAPRGTAPSSWPDNHGFLDKPADTATGLTQVGARWYDPATGTFASLDPLFEESDPQQQGGYNYAGSNPVTHSDPTGLTHCDVGVCPTPWQSVHGPNFCETHNCSKAGSPYNGPAWADPDNNPYSGGPGSLPYSRHHYDQFAGYLYHHRAVAQAIAHAQYLARLKAEQEASRRLDMLNRTIQAHSHHSGGFGHWLKQAAGVLSTVSTIAGMIPEPICPVCQGIAVGAGLLSSGLYLMDGDVKDSGKVLGSTALGLVMGGTGLKFIRTFGTAGKMAKSVGSLSGARRAYGSTRIWLNHGGVGESFSEAARRAGRGGAYRAYWGMHIQGATSGAGMLISGPPSLPDWIG